MQHRNPQDIERRLGQQYAQVLKENAQFRAVYKDCQDVIETSLNLLDHYNRVAMAIKSRPAGRKLAGMFS
jgi:hypothetical protein